MNEMVDRSWKDFKKLGEAKVRQHLATHMYGEDGIRMAKAWLEHKAQERSAGNESQQLAAAKTAAEASLRAADAATRAADAAERQATIADRATKIAIAALIIAIISAIPGLMALFQKLSWGIK
jgi:hypothetical protein